MSMYNSLTWIACFLDAKGTITFDVKMNPKSITANPLIVFASKSPELLDKAKRCIQAIDPSINIIENSSGSIPQLRISGQESCERFLAVVADKLVSHRKQEQARLMMNFIQSRQSRKRLPYSTAEKVFVSNVRRLNKKREPQWMDDWLES